MYYLQSRYYDPEIGRFINADAFTSTGQGLLGNNMYAYCLNSQSNLADPTGAIPATSCGRSRVEQKTDDEGLGIIGSVFLGVAGAAVAGHVASEIAELTDSIIDKMEKSLSKATNRNYRTEYEEHHIVAKKAFNARRAADILNEVLPGGVEDPLNKVMVKTAVHRRIHTNLYYLLANTLVISAYQKADGNKQQQYINVVSSLEQMRALILVLDNLSS